MNTYRIRYKKGHTWLRCAGRCAGHGWPNAAGGPELCVGAASVSRYSYR